MLLIYTPIITNRIQYTFDLIFKNLLGVDYSITTNHEAFTPYSDAKINYSEKAFGDELFIAAHHLLLEENIIERELKYLDFLGSKAFFLTDNDRSLFPFDPFAASFYLVSRYEEYLPFIEDKYGRFEAQESIAFKNNFLQKPVVNIWAYAIKRQLLKQYPSLSFAQKKYEFIPTIDIDSAYAYRLKGFIRNVGGYLRDCIKLNGSEIIHRSKVLLGISKDPFDTFDLLFQYQKQYAIKPIYFILFASYGSNDKNISIHNSHFRSLLRSITGISEVGIHPSFGSNKNGNKLNQEIAKLSSVLNKRITKSRQHFLKLNLPFTYRNLINAGITDDYTMGYASEIGFRAGICSSFYFFDLDLNIPTKLKIHPFAVMDGTLRDYKNYSVQEALSHIKQIVDEVKAVDGTFISLWHNESLSNANRWKGWHAVYKEMLNYALL